MKNKFILVTTGLLLCFAVVHFSSCKSCKKEEPAAVVTADTTTSSFRPPNTIDLPHADTSLIPFLTIVLDAAFDASAKKDYTALASLVIYRGPDSLKFGYDVFNVKNKYDKALVRITADVFNKWNKDLQSREYARVFEMGQPDGRSMPVMEVIFVYPKSMDRKFFGFLLINEEWKIADVTSYL
ncbi:MAG: hypothetical protein V4615_02280 [Bacteroidota bacterium]